MKLSADWFKKILRIGRKPDAAESQADEDVVEPGGTAKTAVVKPIKSDADDTVVVAAPDQEKQAGEPSEAPEEAEPEMPETGKQTLWTRWLKVFRKKSEVDQTEVSADDIEPAKKTGMWATVTALVMRRPQQAASAEADEPEKGEPEAGKEPEEETAKPTWRQRLRAIFKRKLPEADEEDQLEEGKGKRAEEAASAPDKKRKRAGDGQAGDEAVEEEKPLGLGGRIAAILSKKMVWIPLVFLLVALSAFAVTKRVLDMRKQEQAKVDALEMKYKKLQEENRKLQQATKKLPAKPEAKKQADQPASGSGQKGGGDPGGKDDCTISDKASAAEVLKRCIEGFNAADQR